jgi:hypothetical protein
VIIPAYTLEFNMPNSDVNKQSIIGLLVIKVEIFRRSIRKQEYVCRLYVIKTERCKTKTKIFMIHDAD